MTITEKQLKQISRLKQRKYRLQERMFLVEGVRPVDELLKSNYQVEHILVCEAELSETGQKFVEEIDARLLTRIPTRKFRNLSTTRSSQGVVAMAHFPSGRRVALEKFKNLVLIAQEISDPSNLGSLIRSATAFNCGLLIGEGSADIYSAKVIASSAGIIFRSQVERTDNLAGRLRDFKSAGYHLWGAESGGEQLDKIRRIPSRLAVVVGNEAFGIDGQHHAVLDRIIRIPIVRQVESLSAPVAGAIMIYELSRRMNLVK
ncbi:MAG: hypothetical protein GF404_00460 [candidate division Zixibacteria bacterium]|nr:hypothetical protein [candidate division Zixibacteria bacterium]